MGRRVRRCCRSVEWSGIECANFCATRSCLSPPDSALLLREIAAEPRPTGSPAIAAARECCARELRDMGFEVREQPFEFSELPGRFATPLLGGAGAITVGLAGQWGLAGSRFVALVVVAIGTLVLIGAGWWFARRGVLTAPLLRSRGVNLEGTRTREEPRVWLCAHLDSKSQPIPTLVRSVGIVLEGIGLLIAMALAIGVAAGARPHPSSWVFAGLVTLVGAIPVVLSTVGGRSPGALDNASGVVTVLEAARALGDRGGVGVLITDAEELGLAGARAWTKGSQRGTVLNCDGVDDRGEIVVMFTGARPDSVLDAVARASRAAGIPYRASRMIPGVLTDSVAFTDGEFESVTFSKGTWASLARVHSKHDDVAHLHGTGIAETATLIAATVRQVIAKGEKH